MFSVPPVRPAPFGPAPVTSCHSLSAWLCGCVAPPLWGLLLCCVGQVINTRLEVFCVCELFNQLPWRFVCLLWVQVYRPASRCCSRPWLLPTTLLLPQGLRSVCVESASPVIFTVCVRLWLFWYLFFCRAGKRWSIFLPPIASMLLCQFK